MAKLCDLEQGGAKAQCHIVFQEESPFIPAAGEMRANGTVEEGAFGSSSNEAFKNRSRESEVGVNPAIVEADAKSRLMLVIIGFCKAAGTKNVGGCHFAGS